MKKIIVLCTIILSSLAVQKGYAQVGFGTNKPDKSAVVDIVSTKRGLLIPRVNIEDLSTADPVTNPATSLLVYNTNSTTTVEGFYYWDGSKWVRFTSASNEKTYSVTGGSNISVTTTISGTNTDYEVSVEAGSAKNQFLVTKEKGGKLVAEWVDGDDLIDDLIKADNGLTYDSASNTVRLGGALNTNTTITTNSSTATLAIKGLEKLDKNKFDPTTKDVVIMGADGILQKVSPKILVEDAIAEGIDGKTLTSTGSILVTNGKGAVLTDTTIDVAQGGIKSNHLALNSVSTTNIISGVSNTLMVTDENGDVKWISQKDLVTRNQSITTVSGTNGVSVSSNTTASGTEYVVKIKDGGIQSNHLALNSVSTTNIISGADNTIMVTSGTTVMWVNKNDYIKGSQSITTIENGKNTTVSSTILGNVTTYKVNVATASGTTLGVVKQATTNPEVLINDGVLSLDKEKITLSGDVTGNLKSTTISKIQGKAVSATNPTTGQVLTFDGTEWKPVTPTVDASNVSGTGNLTASPASVLEVVNGNGAVLTSTEVKIKAAAKKGSILVTDDAGVVTWTNALPSGTTVSVTNIRATATGVVTIKDGQATVTSVADILSGTLSATNGLTLSGTVVKLGGTLVESTTLVTSDANTLAIKGLQEVKKDKARELLVVETDGTLRTATHELNYNISAPTSGTATVTLTSYSDYSTFVPEVIVAVTLGDSDTNLVLPSAGSAKGQVISVKLLNEDDTHKGYLNVKDSSSNEITYGALPYQAWIIKSDGSNWRVVGSR